MTGGAHRGLRVLDFTRLLPGPYATQMLMHYGAEVIKVEDRQHGDYARDLPPLPNSGFGAAFTASNRGKRSIALDLKDAGDLAVLRGLVAQADVLVESFRPGVMRRLGLGPDDLAADHPHLVYCSISGYGAHTANAVLAGHDLNYQAMAGLLWRPGEPPAMPNALVADLVGGSYSAVIAIQQALLERVHTGKGRFIDLSVSHSATMLLPIVAATHLSGGDIGQASKRYSGGNPAYRLYATSDGRHVAFAALEQKFWDRFCELAGCPQLLGWSATGGEDECRVARILCRIFSGRSLREWAALSVVWDVCLTPVLTPAEAIDGMRHESVPAFAHFPGKDGTATVLSGVPVDLAAGESTACLPPPRHGADTAVPAFTQS